MASKNKEEIPFWIPKRFPIFAKTINTMTIISSRDFRSNQSKYLGLAARGESVILTSRTGSFKIVPISDDDSVMSKAEFLAKIESARNDIENGKGTVITSNKDLKTLLDSL